MDGEQAEAEQAAWILVEMSKGKTNADKDNEAEAGGSEVHSAGEDDDDANKRGGDNFIELL